MIAHLEANGSLTPGPNWYRANGPGHWLQLDAPDQVNALLLDFLG